MQLTALTVERLYWIILYFIFPHMAVIILVQKIFISLFIIFISTIILFWCLPGNSRLQRLIHLLFAKPVIWLGLDNFWSLFAPNPVSKNLMLGFEIEFADGKLLPWKLKELKYKNGFQFIEKTRYIKWHNMIVSQKDVEPKEAVCRYILQEFLKTDTTRAPVMIHIIRYYQPPANFNLLQLEWQSQRAFSFKIN